MLVISREETVHVQSLLYTLYCYILFCIHTFPRMKTLLSDQPCFNVYFHVCRDDNRMRIMHHVLFTMELASHTNPHFIVNKFPLDCEFKLPPSKVLTYLSFLLLLSMSCYFLNDSIKCFKKQ